MKVGREMAWGLWRMLGVMSGMLMAGGTLGWAADDLGVIPAVGELRTIAFPEPVEKILKNGLRVIVVERPDVPLLTVELVVKSGGEVDPLGKGGAMEMLATMLMRGAGKWSAPELAEMVEALGGTIGTGAGWDATTARLGVMTNQAEVALRIFREVILRPTFGVGEVERLRAEMLDELRVKMEEPGFLAKAAMGRLIFGDGPYGHLLGGTPSSLGRIRREDMIKLHATYFRPDNAALILVGSVTKAEGFEWGEKFFGDWKNPRGVIPAVRMGEVPVKSRVVAIDLPTAGQAAVVVGKVGIARSADDYFAGVLASAVLGGGYSARLNAEIRVKRGLTYGASSELTARHGGGGFLAWAQTKNSAGVEVAGLMRVEMEKLGVELVPAVELGPRVSTLLGEYGRSLETNDGFATRLAGWVGVEVPLTMLNRFGSTVREVSAEEIKVFAKTHLRGVETSVVIAGRAESFRGDLLKMFPEAEIISQGELDLDLVSLRVPTRSRTKGEELKRR